MLEGFVGIMMLCLLDNPTQCLPINGPIVSSEIECQVSLLVDGIPSVEENFPGAYVAGLVCMEVSLQGEPT